MPFRYESLDAFFCRCMAERPSGDGIAGILREFGRVLRDRVRQMFSYTSR